MDGILLIDKPKGPTSHDVVAWARRALRERAIGHAGTLDPMATGLLVLLVGRATRLASLLTGKDKTYDATIRLGWATDTDDAEGQPLSPTGVTVPGDAEIGQALDRFRGTFIQVPPDHSAKKIDGTRAYTLARRQVPVPLRPVPVTTHELTWEGRDGDELRLRLRVAAGFYVRALARDLGSALGCGAHLVALRRIRSGHFSVGDALSPGDADALGPALGDRLVPAADALPDVPRVEVTEAGLRRVLHGNWVTAEHLSARAGAGSTTPAADADRAAETAGPVGILAGGRLVALGQWRSGVLHPVAVLG